MQTVNGYTSMSLSELREAFNTMAENAKLPAFKTIKGFKDRSIGIKRCELLAAEQLKAAGNNMPLNGPQEAVGSPDKTIKLGGQPKIKYPHHEPSIEDGDGIPEFLKRPPETREVQEKKIKHLQELVGPDRKIKNPPDAKVTKNPPDAKETSGETAVKTKASGKTKSGKGTKLALIASLLLRDGGCTTPDILKACGWPSVSVPAMAKAAGLKLRKEKDGRALRYFGAQK
jgi:hypothetical protein